jgi:hypothetical protein
MLVDEDRDGAAVVGAHLGHAHEEVVAGVHGPAQSVDLDRPPAALVALRDQHDAVDPEP